MGITFNDNIDVNLFSSGQGVKRVDFSTLALASTGATFSETFKNYESPQAVTADSDLSDALDTATDFFFDQPRHQKQLTIVKVASYADYDTSLSAAEAAMSEVPYFWTTHDRTDANAQDFVDWCTSREKVAFIQSSTPAVASGTGIFDTMQSASEGRAVPIYHHDDTQFVDLGLAAYFGADSPDYNSTIAAYRPVVGATPNGDAFGSTEKSALNADNVNFYMPFYGVNVFYPGKVADGTFMDVVVLKDWFKQRVAEEVAQLFVDVVAAGSKVPFNASGIKMIEGAVRTVANRAYRLGHCEPDSLVINSREYSDYSASERQARELQVDATITITGAAQTAVLNLGLVYSS